MNKPNASFGIKRWVLMVSIVVLSQTMVLALIGASVSDTLPSPREEITVTLSITDTLDFYYVGLEVTYPIDAL